MSYAVHWFRRDLRVKENPALQEALDFFDGKVLGLFCFDKTFLSRPDFSHNRFQFFIHTLKALKADLQNRGGDLLVLDAAPLESWRRLFNYWHSVKKSLPALVSFNKDYEPFARNRDQLVAEFLKNNNVKVNTNADHLLIEPEDIHKPSGGYYQVFTPFFNTWLKLALGAKVSSRLNTSWKNPDFRIKWSDVLKQGHPFSDCLLKFESENLKSVTVKIPTAGASQALVDLDKFRDRILQYDSKRDFPADYGTSGLSVYLKNGSLTIAQIISQLELLKSKNLNQSGPKTFLKELAWREFYYNILYHEPRVESEAFNKIYKAIDWPNNKTYFEKWCEGQTGYPIVDAGMRQLKTTGWMHNRVRMIVASFLVKDLLIDWKWGERFFMQHLLDGDLAPNNGGWQWAASTGCDAQPYFRIFNPTLQSEKFDPEGKYIKKFVPELKDVPPHLIHDPEKIPCNSGYARPIVDHAEQKEKALKLFKMVR